MSGTICLLGVPAYNRNSLVKVAAEAGWAVVEAHNLEDLRRLTRANPVAAVLIDAAGLGLSTGGALQAVRTTAPDALPIVCHAPSETISWSHLAQLGAFHALLSPFADSEVRQSLGFVQEAQRRQRFSVLSVPGRRMAVVMPA